MPTSGQDATTGDGTGTQTGGDQRGPDGEDTAIDDLLDYASVLTEFGDSPVGFILGAVLSYILGGIETVIEAFLDGFGILILGGDGQVSAELGTGETVGLADLPLTVASFLGSSGSTVLGPVIGFFGTLSTEVSEIASSAGPLAPVIYAGMVALLIAGGVWLLRTTISVLADAIPGLQGVIR
jgi:hypothetical protein